jgi:zinc protease
MIRLLAASILATALVACGGGAKSSPAPSLPAGGPVAGGTEPGAPASSGPAPSVVLPATAAPSISVAAWFQVGSVDDPVGKEGLAWLTAQMIARGATQSHKYDQILALLYPMAADYQISVDKEMTVLSGEVHKDHAAAYLALFADAYTKPAFDSADFERLKAEALSHVEKSLRYALDEELGKAAFFGALFAGSGYAHPAEGTVASLKAITLDDVRGFWRDHYSGDRVVFGLAGGWDDGVRTALEATRATLPTQTATVARGAAPRAARPSGRRVLLVDKPGADASISFGAPIDVKRGDPDFAALYLVASWLGEHRNSASHLYQVIRATRGLNYGDYAYVEAYPQGGSRQTPPPNSGRRQQAFEVWIRTLPNENAVFALRAALREIDRLVEQGLTAEQVELQKNFLRKYVLQFAPSTHGRLLWALDDRYYGLAGSHLELLRTQLASLTAEQVNAAIKKHLSSKDLLIAIATGKPALLREQLTSGQPTKPTYATPKPKAVLDEDETIATYPLAISDKAIQVVPVDEMFARSPR